MEYSDFLPIPNLVTLHSRLSEAHSPDRTFWTEEAKGKDREVNGSQMLADLCDG
jgi:hypothetical protein